MTDTSDGPRWAPPGDAEGAPPEPAASDGGTPREDTVAFATEHTQRVSRTDPPPPPPPPAAAAGWAPPAPPGQAPSHGGYGAGGHVGHGGWQPPPAPRRRTGLVVGIVLGVLALVLVLGLGAVLVVRTVSTGPVADGPVDTAPEPDDRAEPDLGVPDPDDVAPDDVEAQADAVLRSINASEERMLAYQDVVFGNLDEDGTVGDGAARIAQEAQEAGNDLTSLRSDLRSLAGGDGDDFDGLRDVRDTYAEHMGAWIDYLDAVAGSPTLASPGSSDAESFWRDIETTGEDFVAAVETRLPEGLPSSLEELARFIVERGFGGFDGGAGGDVV